MCALVANAPADAVGEEVAESDLWAREHLTGDWRGLRTSIEERGVTLTLKHEAETWASGLGGLQTGTIYNGLTTASLSCEMRAEHPGLHPLTPINAVSGETS